MTAASLKDYLDFKKLKVFLQSLVTTPHGLVGVDIGTYALKILWLESEKTGYKLKAWGHLPLGVTPDTPPEESFQKAINLLRGFFLEKQISLKQVATSVSGNAVIVRYVRMPRMEKADLSKTLPIEAEPFIPFDIREVNLGFHILEDVVEEGQKKMEVVLVAAKMEAISRRTDILTGAGLVPLVIDVDAFALESIHEKLPLMGEPGGVLYLNVGHSVTNLSIIENGISRVVRDIFISGSSFTKAVRATLNCGWPEAEEAKAKTGILLATEEKEKALSEGNTNALAVSQAVTGVLKDLVAEMQRSVDFYLSQGPERSIAHVILCGGTANMTNFAQALMAELKVPVESLNPLSFVQDPAVESIPKDLIPAMAVAAGLALRRAKE